MIDLRLALILLCVASTIRGVVPAIAASDLENCWVLRDGEFYCSPGADLFIHADRLPGGGEAPDGWVPPGGLVPPGGEAFLPGGAQPLGWIVPPGGLLPGFIGWGGEVMPADSEAEVDATRLFAAEVQYPPKGFGGYGIVVFTDMRKSDKEISRRNDVCRAFSDIIPTVEESSAPMRLQMVTIWPVDEAGRATELNEQGQYPDCEMAVKHYGIALGRAARDDARKALLNEDEFRRRRYTSVRDKYNSRGPYLFAWSPAIQKGELDVLVLTVDLSQVEGLENFSRIFKWWESEIESDTSVWGGRFNVALVRAKFNTFAEKVALPILLFFSKGEPG